MLAANAKLHLICVHGVDTPPHRPFGSPWRLALDTGLKALGNQWQLSASEVRWDSADTGSQQGNIVDDYLACTAQSPERKGHERAVARGIRRELRAVADDAHPIVFAHSMGGILAASRYASFIERAPLILCGSQVFARGVGNVFGPRGTVFQNFVYASLHGPSRLGLVQAQQHHDVDNILDILSSRDGLATPHNPPLTVEERKYYGVFEQVEIVDPIGDPWQSHDPNRLMCRPNAARAFERFVNAMFS